MTDEDEQPGSDDQNQRLAVAVALGLPLGVVFSLVLDNWAMLGVGLALGIAFWYAGSSLGGAPGGRSEDAADDRPEPEDG